MRSLIRWAVSNSPAMNAAMCAVLLAGGLALLRLRRENFPEFDLELITVTVPYPGASPSEVEEGICLRIEEAIRAIEGIKKITSIAKEDVGTVVAELHADFDDPQRALNEIRSEVDRIPSFPELAEDPQIQQVTLRSPVIRVAVVGGKESPEAEWELRQLAEQIRDELLLLEPVSQVELLSAKDFQIDVEVPEETLRKYGLSIEAFADILRRQNLELPAGTIRTNATEYLVRGKSKFDTGAQIATLPIISHSDGVVLTVGDLATVYDGFEDEVTASWVNGKPALVLVVQKAPEEDTLKIADAVHEYVQQKRMPAGHELQTFDDRSKMVRDRLELLTNNGRMGLLLVLFVLTLFLDFRLAIWVALGIPIALLGSCAVMYSCGATINMISMFAFLLGLGIVVDDAIVVGENVYTHRQMGKSVVEAAVDGTVEVAPSVTASVLTTVCAFLPLFFVSGTMGKFIAVMPLAVVAMLAISLLESLTVLPCHLGHVATSKRLQAGIDRISSVFEWMRSRAERLLDAFRRRMYVPLLRVAVGQPATTISAAVAMLLVAVGVVRSGMTPFIIFPKLDGDLVQATIVYPDGTPADMPNAATERLVEAAQKLNDEFQTQDGPLVKLTYRSVGYAASEAQGPGGGQRTGAHVGWVQLELTETEKRFNSSQEIMNRWRELAGRFPGAEELTFAGASIAPSAKPIEFKIVGSDLDQLEQAVEVAKQRLASKTGVVDVTDDSQPGKWELQLKVKPEAEAMGIHEADLSRTVRATYYGAEVMRLQRGRHEVKLMVRYPRNARRSLANFEEIRVRTPSGDEIPLPVLAHVNVDRGYSEISRINQRRSITVSADVVEQGTAGGGAATANAKDIVEELQRSLVPELRKKFPTVHVRWEGQEEQRRESLQSLFVGFVVAALAMYVLLTIEFRSYVQPLIVLLIIPFGAVGAIFGHLFMGLPLTMFSMFGMVALSGVVVNDSIVLMDFINHRRSAGGPIVDALVDAGQRRFRAVLLTSVTTVAGLLPILVETSMQAQVLIPMAVSLAFGLIMSTGWVLVLVPSVYCVYAQVHDLLAGKRHTDDESGLDPLSLQ